MRRYGIWVSDGGSNSETLAVLRALTNSRLKFGGFADDEGTDGTGWAIVKAHLGDLLMRWKSGCLESNVIKHVPDAKLDEFIRDPEGYTGQRLRTLATRLGQSDASIEALRANSTNFRQLIIDAATGASHTNMEVSREIKKEWKSHGQRWFKTRAGGKELAEKLFTFGVWSHVQDELLPFINAVRQSVGLPDLDKVA